MTLGKLINGNLIQARGKVLKYNDITVANPREEDFIKAGYKPLEYAEKGEDKEGFYQAPVYTELEDRIVVNYEYKEVLDDETL